MKKKNGFTLIELMAVLVLTAVITMIGTYSIFGLQDAINLSMWKNKISLIESGAKRFGEDNKVLLTKSCNTSDGIKTACLTIKVQTLLDRNYISSKDKDSDGNKVFVNESKKENDVNYFVNNYNINVYVENDLVYAELIIP